ncbi:protein hinderin [Amia ocellicauda]|uniref:protein hinderin n=1 Tax=Amia ocellicauda TaxID=2972642 RepID=UPI0034647649
MADVAGGGAAAGIYWTADTSDEDQPMVFIPGLTNEANLRMGLNVKVARSEERVCRRKGSALLSQTAPAYQKMPHQSCTSPQSHRAPGPPAGLAGHQALSETAESRAASLKDLCPEDKRRIANLIQELARVSEEKDETVQRLRVEQESFEKKIQQLEEQNQLIVQERESLQQQYRECQELLALYQQYLSQQQEKLNRSISQLNSSQSSQQLPCDANRAPVLPRGALDGSYLGLPTPRGGSGGNMLGTASLTEHSLASSTRRRGPIPSCSPANPRLSEDSERGGVPAEQPPAQGWRPQMGGSEPRLGRPSQLLWSSVDGMPTRSGSTEPRLGHCSRQHREPQHPTTVPPWGANGLQEPPGRHAANPSGSVWDNRRQKLLLQKMELEVQRERLQALLAQQEEKLLHQHRQLQQSRLDYSRFQDAAVAELEDSISGALVPETQEQARAADRTAAGLGLTSVQRRTSPSGLVSPQEARAPPGVSEDPVERAVQTGRSLSGQEEEPAASQRESPRHSRGAPTVTRRDTATSPALTLSQTIPVPTAIFPKNPDPCLDASLIELLEALSPVSKPRLPRHSRHSVQRKSTLSTPRARPPFRGPATPRSPWGISSAQVGSEEELQESQILEEIFFIC